MSISVNILLKNNIYNPDKHNSVYREVVGHTVAKSDKKEMLLYVLKEIEDE